mmetsp:Transcript_41504/g.89130  ORF Transcript_41504/g.89130 Transcript_41504/m.89130 type:complete len:112 (+) Transcript_41504:549-884(+)
MDDGSDDGDDGGILIVFIPTFSAAADADAAAAAAAAAAVLTAGADRTSLAPELSQSWTCWKSCWDNYYAAARPRLSGLLWEPPRASWGSNYCCSRWFGKERDVDGKQDTKC